MRTRSEGTLREHQRGHRRARAVTYLQAFPSSCAAFVPAASRVCPRFLPRGSMVRRGSTVRVRQRASRDPCKQAILVGCRFAAGPRGGFLETFWKPDRRAALLATAIVSPASDVVQALAVGPVFKGFGPRLRAKGIGSVLEVERFTARRGQHDAVRAVGMLLIRGGRSGVTRREPERVHREAKPSGDVRSPPYLDAFLWPSSSRARAPAQVRRTSRPAGSARPSRTDCPAHACISWTSPVCAACARMAAVSPL